MITSLKYARVFPDPLIILANVSVDPWCAILVTLTAIPGNAATKERFIAGKFLTRQGTSRVSLASGMFLPSSTKHVFRDAYISMAGLRLKTVYPLQNSDLSHLQLTRSRPAPLVGLPPTANSGLTL